MHVLTVTTAKEGEVAIQLWDCGRTRVSLCRGAI